MRPTEDTPAKGVSASGRRLGSRECLRKDCGRRYQARRWNQRYCQEADCLRELRRWQAAKRQRDRRAIPEVREQHAQAERKRRQRKKCQGSRSGEAMPAPLCEPARGHAAKRIPAGPICDRPGCYEPPRTSPAVLASYCGGQCSTAMRRVHDRERKCRKRKTKAGRLKRGFEYQAAKQRRCRQRLTLRGTERQGACPTPSDPLGCAVGFSRQATKTTLPSLHPREVPIHDSQTNPARRPRAPPAP